MRTVWVIAAASLAAALAFAAVANAQGAALIGRPAPRIQVKDLQGKTRSLTEFRGKVVLLCFAASW
jgi:hypothetical protein